MVKSIFFLPKLLKGLVLVLVFTTQLLYAQDKGGISGHVQNQHGQRVSGVRLSLEPGQHSTTSHSNGTYKFSGLPAGRYKLTISYKSMTDHNEIRVEAGAETSYDLYVYDDTSAMLDSVRIYTNQNIKPSSSLRMKANLLEVSQNIQVVDRNLIDEQLTFNISDALAQNVSGVRFIPHQEQASTSIYVRGFDVSNLRNGMDISGSFGPLREDVSFIDRIEFVKGPAGFMMGNTEPGGFYNIVTKKPTGVEKASVKMTLGSYNLYRGEFDVDTKLTKDNRLLFRVNGMAAKVGSFDPYSNNEQYVIAPGLKYNFSEDTDFTLEYIFSQNAFDGGFAKYAYSMKGFKDLPRRFSFADPIVDPTVVKEHNVFANLNHRFNSDWDITAKLGYVNSSMEGESLNPIYNNIDQAGNVDRQLSINDALNTSTVGQVYVNGSFDLSRGVRNNVLAGIDLGEKYHVADWTDIEGAVGPTFNIYKPEYGHITADQLPQVDRTQSIRVRGLTYLDNYSYTSAYIQDELLFLDEKIRLGLGVRYTNTSRKSRSNSGNRVENNAFTPRFSLSIAIDPTLNTYALYDQSFQEQAGMLADSTATSPSLGSNLEIGIKKTWFNGRLMTSLAAYQIKKTNILTPIDPSKIGSLMAQSGEATSKGIELDVNGKISDAWNILINYAFTDAKITKDNDPTRIGLYLPGTAKHNTNAWITYRIQQGNLKGLGFTAGYQFQADRSQAPVRGFDFLPDNYFTLNAGASYQRNQYSINLVVNNLTDRYNYSGYFPGAWGYTHYGYRAMDPINFKLSLGYSFN